MENPEITVDGLMTESVQDTDVLAQPEGEDLSSIMEDTAPPAEPEQAPVKEPGYIKGRIDKAVRKAVEEAKAQVRAEYEAKLAPIYESMIDREAQMLVDSGEVKSLEMAKEYVRMKQGMPVQAPSEDQPQKSQPQRDDHGRFQKQQQYEDDPRLQFLANQANKIKSKHGIDVMDAFSRDAQIQQKVLSGEWDFYDVADALSRHQERLPASPVRSPNGGQVGEVNIMNMTSEQFAQLQKNLASGRRYKV